MAGVTFHHKYFLAEVPYAILLDRGLRKFFHVAHVFRLTFFFSKKRVRLLGTIQDNVNKGCNLINNLVS